MAINGKNVKGLHAILVEVREFWKWDGWNRHDFVRNLVDEGLAEAYGPFAL